MQVQVISPPIKCDAFAKVVVNKRASIKSFVFMMILVFKMTKCRIDFRKSNMHVMTSPPAPLQKRGVRFAIEHN
jgi:hypothetical protein